MSTTDPLRADPSAATGSPHSPPRQSRSVRARARTASEVLLLEALDVAQRRGEGPDNARRNGWRLYARDLVVERLRQHEAVLRHWQWQSVDDSDNEADDRRPLAERVGDAIGSAQAVVAGAVAAAVAAAAFGPPAPPPIAVTRRDAVRALHRHAKALRTLPQSLREEVDRDLSEAHRRYALTGRHQPPWAGRAAASGAAPSGDAQDDLRPLHDQALAGLALSGGGVRSATFALGAFQAMSRFGLLRTVDYMSAVSGGGWAAGWLAAWASRHEDGICGVEDELQAAGQIDTAPLRWVRRYIAYLAPRPGLTSGDTWQLVVAYIAVSLPIVLLVSLALLCLLLLPHLLSAAAGWLVKPDTDNESAQFVVGSLAAIALLTLLSLLRRLTLYYREPGEKVREASGLRWLVWGLTLATTLLLASTAPLLQRLADTDGLRLVLRWPFGDRQTVSVPLTVVSGWAAFSLLSVAVAWLLATRSGQWVVDVVRGRWRPARSGILKRHPAPLRKEAAALLASMLLAAVFTWQTLPLGATALKWSGLRIAYGPLAVMTVFAVAELFGAMLTDRQDVHRAWTARLGAWMLPALVGWAMLCTVALGVTSLWRDPQLQAFAIAALAVPTAGALATVWWSVRRARYWRQAMLLAAGLAGLAFVLLHIAGRLARDDNGNVLDVETLGVRLLFFFALLSLLAWACNVNRYSLHAIYRQGIVRTFLGASRLDMRNLLGRDGATRSGASSGRQFERRRAQPSTDIDDDDNVALKWLVSRQGREMPVLLFNAAVNGISRSDLRGRAPRQWPFTFSQRFCGSPADGIGYARTNQFYAQDATSAGASLGGAMAVSGAAMSPTAGAATRPLRAFVLGVLNARLGVWIGNPAFPAAVRRASPPLGGLTVLREMLGMRARFKDWIHLSDGGHFENLGIYELVRRGCLRIVAIDASCDPKGQHDDLADAIRRAHIDLGVKIYARDASKLQTPGAWMWFYVEYGPDLPRGRLLYIKPSVAHHRSLQAEVLSYWRQSPDFPHEATSRQFFSEQQMEAYRSLGYSCMTEALQAVWGVKPTRKHPDCDPALQKLVRRSA